MWCFAENREGEEKEKGIRISSSGKGGISLTNLRPQEIENVEGMVNNHLWITVTDGRLEVVQRREELPGPTVDEELRPFWEKEKPKSRQLKLFEVGIPNYSHPSIIIRHLCGHYRSPENYAIQSERLESYGFDCLRSRRKPDGHFSEVWILYSIWRAEGELKEVLGDTTKLTSEKSLNKAVEFLCRNVQFGTLDVSFQRAAMPIPD